MERISGGVVVPKYYIDHFSGVTVGSGGLAQVTLSYKPKSVQHIVIQGGGDGTEYCILSPLNMISPKVLRIIVRALNYDPTLLAVTRVKKVSMAAGVTIPPFNVFYEVAS